MDNLGNWIFIVLVILSLVGSYLTDKAQKAEAKKMKPPPTGEEELPAEAKQTQRSSRPKKWSR